MKTSISSAPRPPRRLRIRSLRRFILVWSGAIALAFTLLALDAVLTLRQLDEAERDQMNHARRLQLVQEFEVAALEANRRPASSGGAQWRAADAQLRSLQSRVQTDEAMAPVGAAYRALKTNFDARAPWSDERPFLDALRQLRRAEFARVAGDQTRSSSLNTFSRGAIAVLLLLALAGLAAGGIELWTRVFGPLLKISRAARRFGEGDLSARVPLENDAATRADETGADETGADEIGALAATWNRMASDVESREAERLRFVAAVAHDLKNPLMVVGMAATMMREKPSKFSEQQRDDWLDKIARNARRMEAMIADLTNAVQAQTGALQLQIAPTDLAQIARECAGEIRLAYPNHPIEVSGAQTLEVSGDHAKLERVVANLLSNAAKYSPAHSSISVHLATTEKRAIIEVRDAGAGISPADLKRLFTPFVRLERTEKMAGGTGLGLATTKRIIEAHGGELQVESEVGVGSTFRVVLDGMKRD